MTNSEYIFIFAAAILSLLVAVISFAILYFVRRDAINQKIQFEHNEIARRSLAPDREYIDRQIKNLLEEAYRNPGGFERINELVVQSVANQPPVSSDMRYDSTKDVVYRSRFLSDLGINREEIDRIISESRHDVFVITPFSSDYGDDYNTIKEACQLLDLRCIRGDEQYVSSNLLKYIIESIIGADFVIANISGRNANVFYELAIAQMLEKQVIIVGGLATPIEFDLNQQRVLLFGSKQELIDKITTEIARMSRKK
jgi:hypothetical protein